MRFSLILLALVAAFALARPSAAAAVCPTAKFNNNLPGGWTRMTRAGIKTSNELQANVDSTAAAKYPGCDVLSTQVLKACSQVVAGVQYEYVARAKMTCNGKKKVRFFTSKFLVAPTGR